jgi:excisionase family DNA binding protein
MALPGERAPGGRFFISGYEEANVERALRMSEVSEALQVSIPKALELVRSGALPAVRIGKLWRVRETALNNFLRGEVSGEPSKSEKPRAA